MSHHLTPASPLDLRPVDQPGTSGLADCTMLSAAHGSVHTEVAVSELAPGGSIAGHLHPFEESFYVLEGRPLAMPGYHWHNVRNISIRMMVDDILGAQHHTLFMVQFAPGAIPGRLTAKEHFHRFEEVYYLLAGQARGWLDGEVNDWKRLEHGREPR